MKACPSRAGALGKVPWRDEFLPVAGLPGELRALDAWLFRNARPSNGTAPPEAPAPPFAFLMRLDDREGSFPVAGVVAPSVDRAGRAYPLVVAAPVALPPDVASHAELTPVVLEAYWQVAVEVLASLRAARPSGGDRGVERLVDVELESAADALAIYLAWTRETTVADFCAGLERPLEWIAAAARGMADLASPSARSESRHRLPSIRLPLGGAGGGALCFWLDVLRRSSPPTRGSPTFFWCHDGKSGDALLHLGPVHDAMLAALWGPAPAGSLRDFRERASPPAQPPDGSASLESFLARVQPRSR